MSRSSPTLVAALAAVGAAALWGTTGTSQALGPQGSDPVSVGTMRIVVGALVLVLLAVGRARGGVGGRAASGGDDHGLWRRAPLWLLLLLGGLSVAAYQVTFFLGVARAGVAVGTVIALGAAPVATGVLGLLLAERPDVRWTVATTGAVIGVVLLVSSSGGQGGLDLVGIVAAVGAGISYAGYTILGRMLILRGAPGITVMAWFFSIGALALVPSLLFVDMTWLGTLRGTLMVLWLGIIATGLSYIFFQRALADLPASTVATLSLAEPVTATLLGVIVLREQLPLGSAVGIAVVIGSLMLVSMGRRRGQGRARSASTA